MALSLESIILVKQKCRIDIQKNPGVSLTLKSLFMHLNNIGNPDLQYVAIDYTANADIVVADVACRLFAWCLQKPTASTTDAWPKMSDHATVAAANGDVVYKLIGTGGGGRQYCPTFQDGLIMGTGITTASHTTVNGSTDSNDADAAVGFALIGANS